MTKDDLKEMLQKDLETTQNSLREIIEHNRVINRNLVAEFSEADYSHLEEYAMLSEHILKSAKLLNEINGNAPKVIKDIDEVKEEAKKINLDELID